MVRPADRRAAVGLVQTQFDLSQRSACRALGYSRTSVRYESCRPMPAELIAKLKAHAAARPRWGYRRLHVLLRRGG
jgi:putative transposase